MSRARFTAVLVGIATAWIDGMMRAWAQSLRAPDAALLYAYHQALEELNRLELPMMIVFEEAAIEGGFAGQVGWTYPMRDDNGTLFDLVWAQHPLVFLHEMGHVAMRHVHEKDDHLEKGITLEALAELNRTHEEEANHWAEGFVPESWADEWKGFLRLNKASYRLA